MSANPRVADYAINEQFINRWSPRAFTAEPISEETLLSFLEAARWAPSAYNSQPWRFLYARRDTPNWERYLSLLVPFNRSWAQQASALVLVMSKTTWNKLTPEQQALVKKVAREAQMEERVLWDAKTASSEEKLKAAGVEFITVDKKPFYDATAPVREKYGAQYADLMKRIDAVQ